MSRARTRTRCIASRQDGPPGFTLIEILVALCVVLISLVPLIRLHVLSIRQIDSGMLLARATLLANAKLAEIVAQRDPAFGKAEGRFDDAHQGGAFYWKSAVTEARPSELAAAAWSDMRHVHLDVFWQKGDRDAAVSLDTLVHVVPDRKIEIAEKQDDKSSEKKTNLPGSGR